jgi:hypothetical protein
MTFKGVTENSISKLQMTEEIFDQAKKLVEVDSIQEYFQGADPSVPLTTHINPRGSLLCRRKIKQPIFLNTSAKFTQSICLWVAS